MAEDNKEQKKPGNTGGSAKEEEVNVKELVEMVAFLKKRDEERQVEMERLKYAADKDRLQKFDNQEKSKQSLIPTCKVTVWDGKVILGSKMINQEVYFDSAGVYHEKQDINLFFKDEEKPVVVAYKEFVKNRKQLDAKIIGKRTDEQDNLTYTVQLSDGQEYDIDSNFIN